MTNYTDITKATSIKKYFLLLMLLPFVLACQPSPEKMIQKINRRIERAEAKIEKFENKKTGYEQKIAILKEEAAKEEKVEDKQAVKAKEKIEKLEKEIAKLESTLPEDEGKTDGKGKKVVTVIKPVKKDFERFIEVQGAVTSKDNVMVSSNSGGVVMDIKVNEGQSVSVGQTLAVINSDVLQSNIAEVENALVLAETVYEKQRRLWVDQKIGTEVQYLQAKNNKENLEKKLQTLQVQLGDATVRSKINGVVDEVFTKEGEMVGPGTPVVRVVNLKKVQVEAEIPESYIGKFNKGDNVELYFKSIDLTKKATIRAVSQTLNPGNRTFKIEVDINNQDGMLKPYMLATLKLQDYKAKDQIILPTKLIQDGSKGEFVYTYNNGVVERNWIERGKTYNGESEIKDGLTVDDKVINLGFRNVLEGEEVKLETDAEDIVVYE